MKVYPKCIHCLFFLLVSRFNPIALETGSFKGELIFRYHDIISL